MGVRGGEGCCAGAQGTCDQRSAAVTRTEVIGDGKILALRPSSSSALAGAGCGVNGVGSAARLVGGAVGGAALLDPAPPPPPFPAGTSTCTHAWTLACLPRG